MAAIAAEAEGARSAMHRAMAAQAWTLAILTLALAVVAVGSLLFGRYPIAPAGWWRVLSDPRHSGVEGVVLLNVRLPRVIAGMLIGGGLALAGAAYQGLFRNPMVSPDILGASAGAGFGAAAAILFG